MHNRARARRSSWVDEQAAILVEALAESGIVLSHERAAIAVENALDRSATVLNVSTRTAHGFAAKADARGVVAHLTAAATQIRPSVGSMTDAGT
jgi:hypothetical protein